MVSGVVHPSLSYWLCGAAATEQQLSRGAVVPDWADMLFAQGGTAVLRDGWDSNAAVAIVDAGQHGALNCGHAHADALSCTLSLGGSDVFVDRGTLTYIGMERNEFRATCSHNTLEFDAESSVSPLGPFQWGQTPKRPAARLRTSGNLRVFEAIAHGHAGTTNPSTHQRVILHLPHGAWIVYDRGNRQGARGAVARWQLAPGLTVNECADGAYDLLDSQQQTVGRVVAPLSASIVVRQRDVSPRYGSRLPAQVFELGTDSQLRALTLLLPTMLNWPLPNIARISATDRSGWEWHDAHGNHRIMVSPESSRRIVGLLGWNIDADLLWCCRASPVTASDGFTADLMVVVNATLLVAPDGTEFASVVDASPGQARGAVVLSRTPQGWAKMATSEPVRGLEPK